MTDKLTITEYPAMIREIEYPPLNREEHRKAVAEHSRLSADGWEYVGHRSHDDNMVYLYVKQLEPAK